ncbi:MAG: 2Fe-2S iron-sulfur cluster-binding protein [Gammaproteobacteria bacterium]|nr:2Fe-2S iron-sulfur cluster-binding protein [Gammaproteobacteria bacterium]
MISLKINKQLVQAKPGQTLLQVATKQGIEIPTLCHLPGLEARSVCRICSVEVKGQSRLLPACSTVVEPNMEVETHSQKTLHARQVLLEFIIAEHGGLATLSPQVRAYAQTLGVTEARFYLQQSNTAVRNGSDYIRYQPDKCIHCDRCISACRDQRVINRANRGAAIRLTFGANDTPLAQTNCSSCGDCVAVCPSGALSEQG